jgi:glycosyltransferase involved in cell wall biosynthesis
MRIVIQARDLDHRRIDGTRVYLKQLLARFGALAPEDRFEICHRDDFNPELLPGDFTNYTEKRLAGRLAWMQTSFAWAMFRKPPEKVFLPLQAAPLFFPQQTEITATIHDLAFRFYPETFPLWDRMKLRVFLRIVLWRATKIITVSHATKRDLLHFYPHLLAKKQIEVIHHGFDESLLRDPVVPQDASRVLEKYHLVPKQYFLYVGALQPRKNIERVVAAFEQVKEIHKDAKFVLAGEAAWLSEGILKRIAASPVRADIVHTGGIDFQSLRVLYQNARVFVFPSLYEGFGLPVLEAFACDVPVLVSENSSLREVAGEAAWYCDAFSVDDIAEQMTLLWQDDALRERLITRGGEQLKRFSWDKTAKETLEFIRREVE